MAHIPVLLNEILEYLRPKPGDVIIDATFSGGGHSSAILEKIKPHGKILGIELDDELYEKAREKFSNVPEIVLANDNYKNFKKVALDNGFEKVDGILIDLGMSSWHVDESGRGFSFQKDEPLDMRYSRKEGIMAAEIVNQWPPETIEKVLEEYGEEKFAGPISRAIVEARQKKPIISTFQLVEAIRQAKPSWRRGGSRINFATKTFQALRIVVNGELGNLTETITQIPDVLRKSGRGLIISFHSLEDRIVKGEFRRLKEEGKADIITKKPIRPSAEEINANRRSRSAKLRVIEAK